jgi:hypothetical protein
VTRRITNAYFLAAPIFALVCLAVATAVRGQVSAAYQRCSTAGEGYLGAAGDCGPPPPHPEAACAPYDKTPDDGLDNRCSSGYGHANPGFCAFTWTSPCNPTENKTRVYMHYWDAECVGNEEDCQCFIGAAIEFAFEDVDDCVQGFPA